jgi:hypothetical protein
MKFSKQHRWNFVATGKLKNMMDGLAYISLNLGIISNKTGHKLEQQLYYYLPDRISTNNPNNYPFAEKFDSKLQIFRTF